MTCRIVKSLEQHLQKTVARGKCYGHSKSIKDFWPEREQRIGMALFSFLPGTATLFSSRVKARLILAVSATSRVKKARAQWARPAPKDAPIVIKMTFVSLDMRVARACSSSGIQVAVEATGNCCGITSSRILWPARKHCSGPTLKST